MCGAYCQAGHCVASLAPSAWLCCNIYLPSPRQHLSDDLNVFREGTCYSDMRYVLLALVLKHICWSFIAVLQLSIGKHNAMYS
jgi:hypothetical protein